MERSALDRDPADKSDTREREPKPDVRDTKLDVEEPPDTKDVEVVKEGKDDRKAGRDRADDRLVKCTNVDIITHPPNI